MNILIVDDLVSVVNGIIKGIDWNTLGILGIYKAHNSYEAKVLMNNLKIDILLTDIEMPGESGLDLAEWVREMHFDTTCIFMSSHADFDYARRAIRSGGYSYVLLPCPYEEIIEAIRGAMEALKKSRKQRELYQYGKLVSEDVWLAKVIFGEALEDGKNRQAVEKLVELGRFGEKTDGYLCHLKINDQSVNEEQWDLQLMEFTLNNVISELVAPVQQQILMYCADLRNYWFFCYNQENSYAVEKGIFERQMLLIKETMKGILRLDCTISYDYCQEPYELSEKHALLAHQERITVSHPLLFGDMPKNRWLEYYNTPWIGNLEGDVAAYLESSQKEIGQNLGEICIRLHADLIQLMYQYLNQYNDSIFYIFETQAQFERYIHAYQSTEDLLWLVGKLAAYIKKRAYPAIGDENPVEMVTRYVQNHIAQDIKRSDLAEHVHLNIDYLSRIFKREKGMTLNDYIIEEKMKVAKNLIVTTRLPVSLIAVKVGYSNFSYFSKIYRKIHGCSPAEEREKA